MKVYQNICEANGQLSPDTQQELLEFLAYHNCSEDELLAETEWVVERWQREFLANQKNQYVGSNPSSALD